MTDHTPTTNQVRGWYIGAVVATSAHLGKPLTVTEAEAQFDRWLEAETARIGALTLKLLTETEDGE